jgi:hypothetical protein
LFGHHYSGFCLHFTAKKNPELLSHEVPSVDKIVYKKIKKVNTQKGSKITVLWDLPWRAGLCGVCVALRVTRTPHSSLTPAIPNETRKSWRTKNPFMLQWNL